MSWFGITDIAKNAFTEAQKKIDKVLDIQADESTLESPNSKNDASNNYDYSEPRESGKSYSHVTNLSHNSSKSNISGTKVATLGKRNKKSTGKLGTKLPSKSTDLQKPNVLSNTVEENFVNIPLLDDNLSETKKSPSKDDHKNEISNIMKLNDLSSLSDMTQKNLLIANMQSQPDNQNSEINKLEIQNYENPVSQSHSPTTSSTTASSEIDILDHESTTSDVSSFSKCTENDIYLQSPVSFVSSQLNPHSDIELLPGSGYSSPPNITDDENYRYTNDKGDFMTPTPILLGETSIASTEIALDNEYSEIKEMDKVTSGNDQNEDKDRSTKTIKHEDEKEQNNVEHKGNNENNKILEQLGTNLNLDESNKLDNQNLDKVQSSTSVSPKVLYSKSLSTEGDCESSNEMVLSSTENDQIVLLSEKLEVYEQKLFSLSQANAQLNEDNDNFKSEIMILKEKSFQESNSQVQKLEIALENIQNKLNIAMEEKNNIVKQCDLLQGQLASRMSNEQVQQALMEKEESIKGLLEEGEKLSKQHLQQNNLIKKLKSQGKEKQSLLETTKDKLEKMSAANEDLKKELEEIKSNDKENKMTSIRISEAYEEREEEILALKERCIASEEKQETLQNNLDSAYKEIADMNKKLAEKESIIKEEWARKEEDLQRQMSLEVQKKASEYEHQKQLMMLQIMDLNNTIQRNEAVLSRKNSELKSEIKDLQDRLQQSEIRNQELTENVSAATVPLLRQMENLQTTFSTQQRSWLALEKSLNSRLEESNTKVILFQERERAAQTNLSESKAKIQALDQQLLIEKQKYSQLINESSSLKQTNIDNTNEIKTIKAELQSLHSTYSDNVEKLKNDKLALENQLNMEKVRSEADLKKLRSQHEIWQREKEKQSWLNRSELMSSSSMLAPDTESINSEKDSAHLIEHSISIDQGYAFNSAAHSLGNSHSFSDLRGSSTTTAFERFQSQIKRNEGEIAQLHGEINRLERTRSSMAEEIVRLTNENEDLESSVKDLSTLKETLKKTETRYNLMLAMYGEKEEENEELRMDLADVKAMYRQQINDLLKADSQK